MVFLKCTIHNGLYKLQLLSSDVWRESNEKRIIGYWINGKKSVREKGVSLTSTQLTFICSKLTIKTLEKGLKYVQS